MCHGLDRVRQAAKEQKGERFTALLHHIDVELLGLAYGWLRKEASAGVDGVTWEAYGEGLDCKLVALHYRIHRGAYRAQPSRRVYIPKPDGRERPLGIAALEDKIVQRALVEVLNAILIRKWLKAGVAEEGQVTPGEVGTPQGAVISPLLANIYLHYLFDLWADQWRKRHVHGDVIMVRYADDIVVGFEHQADAERFWGDMRARLAEFALTLHPGKTRLIEFGRHAAKNRRACGLGKPETFNFLGFTYIGGHSRRGGFRLKRKSRSDRVRARLQVIRETLRRRMHETVDEQGAWLRRVVMGLNAYHAVPTNAAALEDFRHNVADLWRRTLRRRGQKGVVTWERMTVLANRWLPTPRITHPWPDKRFAVKHPRWEPGAGIPPAGICAGALGNMCSYRDPRWKAVLASLPWAGLSIRPMTGHCLVVPKTHCTTIFEISPDTFASVAHLAARIAVTVRNALRPAGSVSCKPTVRPRTRRCRTCISTCCRGNRTMGPCSTGPAPGKAIRPGSPASPRTSARTCSLAEGFAGSSPGDLAGHASPEVCSTRVTSPGRLRACSRGRSATAATCRAAPRVQLPGATRHCPMRRRQLASLPPFGFALTGPRNSR